MISFLKTLILAEKSSVLCFVYHSFVQIHLLLDVFGGTKKHKTGLWFCVFVQF
jgi:hypothetical protein